MAEGRVTITDVAKLAGTSTATVSHYLNGKYSKMSGATRERIKEAIGKMGYAPNARARDLANKHSEVVAVLIEDNTNAWAGRLVSGVEACAYENGYQTVVCDTHFDQQVERDYVEKMLSLGVDGFVVQPTNHYRAVNQRLRNAGKPVVFYDFNLLDLTSTWVKTDLYGGVYDAISECAERGYEDFVLMTADVERMRTRSERYQGAVDALAERGIGCEQLQITHKGPPARELRRYLEQQLNPARRTLIFCAHQWALPRVFEALSDMRHLVPEQIGLLGLNNAEWAGLTTPSISTIVEPVEKEGRIACSMLIDLMRDPNAPPQQKVLPCTTRWLASTLEPQEGQATGRADQGDDR